MWRPLLLDFLMSSNLFLVFSPESGYPAEGEPGEDDRGTRPAHQQREPGERAEQAHAASDPGREGGDDRTVQKRSRSQPQKTRAGEFHSATF